MNGECIESIQISETPDRNACSKAHLFVDGFWKHKACSVGVLGGDTELSMIVVIGS